MLCSRVIARLDIKGPNLVKGVHLEGLRVLGEAGAYTEHYYLEGIDEIIYLDTVASLYGRPSLHELLQSSSDNCWVPLTAGGGVRTVDDARQLLRSGADKVAINTAAVHRPQLLSELADAFGSQCIVLQVDARAGEVLTDNAREISGRMVTDWIQEAQDLGIGEILLTSVDRDGTGRGFDLELIATCTKFAQVPLIVSGGPGCLEHVSEGFAAGADAVALASLLHYEAYGDKKANEGNTEFLSGLRGGPPFPGATVSAVKAAMQNKGLEVRWMHC